MTRSPAPPARGGLREIALGLTSILALLGAACEKRAVAPVTDAFPILTPPAPATPRINGPRMFGARPGSPFRYQVPATGVRPMEFSADDLPAGLTIDQSRGLIAGSWAVGLFNLGSTPRTVEIRWPDLKLSGPAAVRDLWWQKDLGRFAEQLASAVAPHGAVLLRVRGSGR